MHTNETRGEDKGFLRGILHSVGRVGNLFSVFCFLSIFVPYRMLPEYSAILSYSKQPNRIFILSGIKDILDLDWHKYLNELLETYCIFIKTMEVEFWMYFHTLTLDTTVAP